ncbi:hypothetical protein SNL152K_3887 [Streptomyces sp. NL15-2K]|nr:hypothetical protein SNL152K_3887 [Streptomyces sp. NL15-2K]
MGEGFGRHGRPPDGVFGVHGTAQAHGTVLLRPLPDGPSHPSAPVTARRSAYRARRAVELPRPSCERGREGGRRQLREMP